MRGKYGFITKAFLVIIIKKKTKEILGEINQRKIRSHKTGYKVELEVKEAKIGYNLEGQLIKCVASTEPSPINMAPYETNHSLITTSHPFYGPIYHMAM